MLDGPDDSLPVIRPPTAAANRKPPAPSPARDLRQEHGGRAQDEFGEGLRQIRELAGEPEESKNPGRLTTRVPGYWLWFRGSSCDPRAERSARE